uniref:Uncharacterized protein n=1 Tax=Solanum tuberosum TaxID=4113 RepID=M0ZGI0_SOLTU
MRLRLQLATIAKQTSTKLLLSKQLLWKHLQRCGFEQEKPGCTLLAECIHTSTHALEVLTLTSPWQGPNTTKSKYIQLGIIGDNTTAFTNEQ